MFLFLLLSTNVFKIIMITIELHTYMLPASVMLTIEVCNFAESVTVKWLRNYQVAKKLLGYVYTLSISGQFLEQKKTQNYLKSHKII